MQHNNSTLQTLLKPNTHTLFVELLLIFVLINSAQTFAAPGDILFQDLFNTDLSNWTVTTANGNASIGNETFSSGSSLRLRWNTVTITSNAFNASIPGATVTVWIRRGLDAFSEDPDAGEDLVFEYLNSTGTWVILETFNGNGTDGEIYNRSYVLAPDALHANLRLRFRLLTGSGNDFDYWHIDDLRVTETALLIIGLNSCDNFESGLGNWTSTGTGSTGINNMTFNSPGNSMFLRWSAVQATSGVVNYSTSTQARITAWIRRGSDAFSENPEAGENLVLEYFNNVGAWVALETFPGGGTPGEIFNRSYILGAAALHPNFRIQFRLVGGSGSNFDYFHVDDVCFYNTVQGPLIWYKLDETTWSGSSTILDATGNGNNGNPVAVSPANPASNPAKTGSPGTCGYATIPNNSSDTINAIDTNFVPGNSGTISFWYNNNSNWDTNGDRLLFDASNDLGNNTADKSFFLIRRDNNNGSLRFVIDDSNDTTTIANASNLTFAADTWVHIAVTWDLPGDLTTIYVNGVSQATSTTNVNGIMGNVSDVYIGDNRMTGAGANGWTNESANGLIDEVQIYNTAISQTLIVADMNATHACTLINHFNINHDTSAVNCQAEPVAVQAHNAAHAVDTGYTGTINLSTSTAHGDWGIVSAGGSLNNGVADDGAATYTMVAGDNGSVTLELKNTHVETLNINVSNGTVSELSGTAIASEDQNLNFAATGFSFLANGVASTIGLQIGGKSSDIAPGAQTLELQAIRTSPVTGACEAALQDINPIQLAFECRNPTTCTANQININGGTATSIAGNPFGVISSYTPVNLDFGDTTDTTASFVLNYPDVGELRLHARYNIPLDDGSGTPSGVYMLGSSNSFVSRPFGLSVTATGNPAATGPAGTVYTQAGNNFTVTSTAVLYQAADDSLDNNGIADGHNDTNPANNANLADNLPALNYGRESPIEAIGLGELLNQPVAGNDPGLSGTTTLSAFTNGSGNTTTARYDEAGIIEISSAVSDGDYLGIGVAATNNIVGKSGYVGRFIPNHFAIANTVTTNRSDILACTDPFTYMDENFLMSFNLQAFNARTPAVITQNYRGAFAKLDVTALAQMNYGATSSGTNLTTRLTTASAGNFVNGTAAVQATSALARLPAPNGPYPNLQLGIAPADSDSVALQTLNLSLAGGPNTHGTIGNTDVRYGRLTLASNFGSELLPLSMQLQTQYYANVTTQFITNTNDNCSALTTADVLLFNNLAPKQGRALGNTVININAGNTTTLTGISAFINGTATMNFTAPDARGYVDMEVQTPVYLRSNLDGVDQGIQGPGQHCTPGMAITEPAYIPGCVADAISVDDVPLSRGTFGIFRGSDRVIYIREVY